MSVESSAEMALDVEDTMGSGEDKAPSSLGNNRRNVPCPSQTTCADAIRLLIRIARSSRYPRRLAPALPLDEYKPSNAAPWPTIAPPRTPPLTSPLGRKRRRRARRLIGLRCVGWLPQKPVFVSACNRSTDVPRCIGDLYLILNSRHRVQAAQAEQDAQPE
jgi:hypothetical protein